MKRRIFSILFALVLALSLVTAVPAAAEVTTDATIEFVTAGSGAATVGYTTDETTLGDYSVALSAWDDPTGAQAKVRVLFDAPIPLADFTNPTFEATGVVEADPENLLPGESGEGIWNHGPYLNILLDADGDGVEDDALEGVVASSLTDYNPLEWRTMEGTDYYDSNSSLGGTEGYESEGDATIGGDGGLDYWRTLCPDAQVVGVRIAMGYSSHTEIDQVSCVDGVTIGDTTYDLEQPATVWVATTGDNDNPGTETEPFLTIQYAIDILADDCIVNVAAGTYTEDPAIDQALTLSGPNATISPNTGTRVTEAIIVGTISVTASDITIQGFDFEVADTEDGIYYPQFTSTPITGLNILNNSFEEMSPTRAATSADGAAIMFHIWENDASVTAVIDDNLFVNIWGVYYEVITGAAISTVTITDNVFTGATGDSLTPFAGISVKKVTGTISDNTITNTYDAGINVAYWCDDLTISDNTITNANTSDGANAGAINLYSDCTDITITGNTLADSYDGITIKDVGDALGSGIAINYNDISGNSNRGLSMSGLTGTLDAENNWWEDICGPDHSGNPYDGNVTTGDVVDDQVDYIPWMIHNKLVADWNLWSVPIAPDTDTDTLVDALDIFGDDSTKFLIGYYFDGEEQSWGELTLGTKLTPLQALYLEMSANATIDVCFSPDFVPLPSATMYTKWNLVGPAELYGMLVDEAVVDAYYGTGQADLVGYSRVISPSLNQDQWSFLRDSLPADEACVADAWEFCLSADCMLSADPESCMRMCMRGYLLDPHDGCVLRLMLPTRGYWVYMVNQGTLGGFTSTPITEQE